MQLREQVAKRLRSARNWAGLLEDLERETEKVEGGPAVLKILEGLDRAGRSESALEVDRQVRQYVCNHMDRMDYPSYRAKGWLIGSGPVEAACKQVVGQRLKGSGMRWGEAGADAVCHLRALYLSQPGQWESFWKSYPN